MSLGYIFKKLFSCLICIQCTDFMFMSSPTIPVEASTILQVCSQGNHKFHNYGNTSYNHVIMGIDIVKWSNKKTIPPFKPQ